VAEAGEAQIGLAGLPQPPALLDDAQVAPVRVVDDLDGLEAVQAAASRQYSIARLGRPC
jgi:hypothetical protein